MITKAKQINGNRRVYAATGVVVLLFAGLIYAWSILSAPIAAEFSGWSSAQFSFTFTLTMIMFCLGNLAGGFWGIKISVRWNLIASGILFFVGFLIAANTQTLAMLYIGFGVCGGIASGYSYNIIMSTVMNWFLDQSGMISGVLLMGFGIGSFFIGKVYQALTPTETGGWRTSFQIFAAILLLVMVLASFIIKKSPQPAESAAAIHKTSKTPVEHMDIGPFSMMKRRSFWLYYLWAIVLSMAGLALVSQARGIATEAIAGINAGTLATIVGLISVLNGIGRVCFGALFDRHGHRVTLLVAMIVFVLGELTIIAALKTHILGILVLGYIIGGFAYGAINPMNSALIKSFYGSSNYAENFSIINTCLIPSSFASTIAGGLYDASGSYTSTVFMMLVTTLLGVVFYIGIEKP